MIEDKTGKPIQPGDYVVLVAKVKSVHPTRLASNLEVQDVEDKASAFVSLSGRNVTKLSEDLARNLITELAVVDMRLAAHKQQTEVPEPRIYEADELGKPPVDITDTTEAPGKSSETGIEQDNLAVTAQSAKVESSTADFTSNESLAGENEPGKSEDLSTSATIPENSQAESAAGQTA